MYDGIGLEASDNVGRETVQRNVEPPRTSTATTDVAHATDVRVRGGACHLPADEAGEAETLGNEGDEDSDDDRSQFTGIGDISLLQFEFIDDTVPTDVFEKITDEDEEEEYFECNPDRDDDIQICPVDAEPDLRTDRKGTLMWATFDSGAGRSCTSKALAEKYGIGPSHGSRTGQKFVGPGNEVYRNVGEVTLPLATEDGRAVAGEFQAVDGLAKTLIAVSDSCKKGNMTVFPRWAVA